MIQIIFSNSSKSLNLLSININAKLYCKITNKLSNLKMAKNFTSRAEDYSKWYNELVVKGRLS